jgi:hypothetical protein
MEQSELTKDFPAMPPVRDDDEVEARFILPAELVRSGKSDITVVSCAGASIPVPQSFLKVAREGSEQVENGITVEFKTTRSIGRMVSALVDEVVRLTIENNRLKEINDQSS